jgi:hypothetical protein
MTDDESLFRIESPTRVWLSKDARDLARSNGMSDAELARHLLQQHNAREAGLIQRVGEN